MLSPHMAKIIISTPNTIVSTSFNNDEVIRQGEYVVKCICGVSFIAHERTQTCVACCSNRLDVLMHYPHKGEEPCR